MYPGLALGLGEDELGLGSTNFETGLVELLLRSFWLNSGALLVHGDYTIK
jgi:hypothetical protein